MFNFMFQCKLINSALVSENDIIIYSENCVYDERKISFFFLLNNS